MGLGIDPIATTFAPGTYFPIPASSVPSMVSLHIRQLKTDAAAVGDPWPWISSALSITDLPTTRISLKILILFRPPPPGHHPIHRGSSRGMVHSAYVDARRLYLTSSVPV